MKTAHRKASQHKRRWIADPFSMFRVFNKAQLFTKDEQAKLTNPARLAYEKLRTGVGLEGDFHVLAACVNVTMILAEKIDPLAERIAVDARDSMNRTWHRLQRTGALGFDGPALQDLPPALDLHDQLMALLTPLQVSEAVAVINQRIADGEVLQ